MSRSDRSFHRIGKDIGAVVWDYGTGKGYNERYTVVLYGTRLGYTMGITPGRGNRTPRQHLYLGICADGSYYHGECCLRTFNAGKRIPWSEVPAWLQDLVLRYVQEDEENYQQERIDANS